MRKNNPTSSVRLRKKEKKKKMISFTGEEIDTRKLKG